MRFVALDLETANSRFTSICQIGISVFEDNREVEAVSLLVDPNDYFDAVNVLIHGIDENAVRGKPRFEQAFKQVEHFFSDSIVVSHTPFDRTTLLQACKSKGIVQPKCTWLDSSRVVRRAYPQFAERGYSLANVAKEFGMDFNHHDALEDARVAGAILIQAIADTGIQIEEWLKLIEKPVVGGKYPERIRLEGKLDGPLAGEVCVFTGQLKISRSDAATIANEAGAAVEPGVNKKTTIVVVGDQDLERLAGKTKSAKHLKAEELAAKGFPIRILQERDFVALLD
ncbi:MAG: exonuclease domain-containing protein [Aestuariivirga sp.]